MLTPTGMVIEDSAQEEEKNIWESISNILTSIFSDSGNETDKNNKETESEDKESKDDDKQEGGVNYTQNTTRSSGSTAKPINLKKLNYCFCNEI